MGKVAFLGINFDAKPPAEWLDLLASAATHEPFDYLVTPNVDHVVCYNEGVVHAPAYDAATFNVCDSRILAMLAKMRGLDLKAYPGSDLVRDFMDHPASQKIKIAVFGPSAEDFAQLKATYPAHDLLWIDAPILKPGTHAWDDAVKRLLVAPFDLLLCCISFPKQEALCHALKQAGRARGLAVCAGASLDFLTGKQVRAPAWMNRAYIEWLHRLFSDPRRMWHRYLVRGPRIFLLFLRNR